MTSNEPPDLVRGKRFHALVQQEWLRETFGEALPEQSVSSGAKRGRIDVRMIDPNEPMAFVVEVKDSLFDRMDDRSTRRNVARHRLQVSRYGEALLNEESNGIEFVCLAVVYSTEPVDMRRRDWIENYLGEYMTACFWHNTKRSASVV